MTSTIELVPQSGMDFTTKEMVRGYTGAQMACQVIGNEHPGGQKEWMEDARTRERQR